jgi:hypothetical protein
MINKNSSRVPADAEKEMKNVGEPSQDNKKSNRVSADAEKEIDNVE